MIRIAQWIVGSFALLIAGVSAILLTEPRAAIQHLAHYVDFPAFALLVHMVAGPLSLALVPLQFWGRMRSWAPMVHRWAGRIYVVAAMLGAVSILMLLPQFRGSVWAGTGMAVNAVLWLLTTGRALWLARARRFGQHRRWMLRSAACTCSAISLRLIMAPLIALGWEVTETYVITAWASWMVSLTLVEIYLRWSPAPLASRA
jgi:hypothetical protein